MADEQLRFTVTQSGAEATAAALEKLAALQGQINSGAGAQVAAAASTASAHQAAADRIGEASQKLRDNQTLLTQAVGNLAEPIQRQQTAWVSLGAAMGALPGPAGEIAGAFGAISVSMTRTQADMIALGAGLTQVGLMLTASLGEAVQTAAEFSKQLGVLRAVLPGPEIAQFGDALKQLALNLGRDTVFSASEAMDALTALARQGVSAQAMLNGVGLAAVNMAGAMGTSTTEAALTLGSAMREFNLPATEAAHVADMFSQAVHVAGLNAEEMRNGVSRVAPIVNALGGTLQDTVTGMELLARSGVEAGRAGTMLAQVYEDVVNPRNKQAAALMEQLGLYTKATGSAFVTAAGTIRPFPEIVQILAQAFERLTPAQMAAASQTEFSRRAMQAALVMVNAYRNDGVEKLTDAQANARTAADAMAERMNNLAGSLKMLSSSVETAKVDIGDTLAPVVRGVAGDLTSLTNAFLSLPPAGQQTATALLAVGAAATTLAGVWLIANGAAVAFGTTVGAAGAAALALIGPIGLVATAVAVLAAAWINDWGNIRETTEAVAAAMEPTVTTTVTALGTEKDYLTTVLIPAWQQYWAAKLHQGQQALQQGPPSLPSTSGLPEENTPIERPNPLAGIDWNNLAQNAGKSWLVGWATALGGGGAGAAAQAVLNALPSQAQMQQAVAQSKETFDTAAGDLINAAMLTAQRVDAAMAEGWQHGLPQTAMVSQAEFDRIAAQMNAQNRNLAAEMVDGFQNALAERSGQDVLGPFMAEMAAQWPAVQAQAAASYRKALDDGLSQAEAGSQYHPIIDAWVTAVKNALNDLAPGLGDVMANAIIAQIQGQARAQMVDAATETGTAVTEATATGLAPLPERIAGYLDETVKVVRDKQGEITKETADFKAALADALGKGDTAGAVGIMELERAASAYQATLARLTPEQAVYAEQVAAAAEATARGTGGLAAMTALVAAGILPQERLTEAINGTTAAHQQAQTALQAHETALHTWLASADAATVAGGLWAQQVDTAITKLAQEQPALAAVLLAAKNTGDTEAEITAIMQTENLTREQAIALIQRDTAARAAHGRVVQQESADYGEWLSKLEDQREAKVFNAIADALPPAIAAQMQVTRVTQDMGQAIQQASQTVGFSMDLVAQAFSADSAKSQEAIQALIGQIRALNAEAAGTAAHPAFSGGYGDSGLGAGYVQYNAQQMGVAIQAGLAAGLDPQEAYTQEMGSRLIDSVFQNMADAAEIHSPSQKAAAQIGQPIAAGVAAGLQQGAPAVQHAAADMFRQVLDAYKASGLTDAQAAFQMQLGIAPGNPEAAVYKTANYGQGPSAGSVLSRALDQVTNSNLLQKLGAMDLDALQSWLLHPRTEESGRNADLLHWGEMQGLRARAGARDRGVMDIGSAAGGWGLPLGPSRAGQMLGATPGETAALQGPNSVAMLMMQYLKAQLAENPGATSFVVGGQDVPAEEVKQWIAQLDQAQASTGALGAVTETARASVQHMTSGYLSMGSAASAAGQETAGGMAYLTTRTKEAEQAALQASKAWGAALMAGESLVAGIKIPAGLTTSQIYSATATGSATQLTGGGSGTVFTPTSLYGLPIVSPLTPGTLRGYAEGGLIPEPSYLVSMRSGQAWGTVAEHGPEVVGGPGAGGPPVHLTVNVQAGLGADQVLLRDRGLWQRLITDQIAPVLATRGVKV